MLKNDDIIKRRGREGLLFFNKDRSYRSEYFEDENQREKAIEVYIIKANKAEEKRLLKSLKEKELIKAINQ